MKKKQKRGVVAAATLVTTGMAVAMALQLNNGMKGLDTGSVKDHLRGSPGSLRPASNHWCRSPRNSTIVALRIR